MTESEHETSDPETQSSTSQEPTSSGDKSEGKSETVAGEDAGKKPRGGRRFSEANAREMAARSWEKRREKAVGGTNNDMTVTVPIPHQSVVEGLISAASKGSAPAARELRAWLAEYPVQVAGQDRDRDLVVRQPEDMTPEQLERARAWELRRIARLERRHEGLAALRKNGLVEPREEHAEGR